jgi:hypothetical protein
MPLLRGKLDSCLILREIIEDLLLAVLVCRLRCELGTHVALTRLHLQADIFVPARVPILLNHLRFINAAKTSQSDLYVSIWQMFARRHRQVYRLDDWIISGIQLAL